MARRRFVQIDGDLVEVAPDYVGEVRAHVPVAGDRHYDGLRAPDAERTDISSRTKHRNYMRERNLATVDDFRSTWNDAAKARANIQRGSDPARRNAIERAVHFNVNRKTR